MNISTTLKTTKVLGYSLGRVLGVTSFVIVACCFGVMIYGMYLIGQTTEKQLGAILLFGGVGAFFIFTFMGTVLTFS